jgi:hypothetical protein
MLRSCIEKHQRLLRRHVLNLGNYGLPITRAPDVSRLVQFRLLQLPKLRGKCLKRGEIRDQTNDGEMRMFDQIDAAYYRTRAQEERDKAEMAEDDGVRATHLQLAATYEEKVQQLLGYAETD